MKAIYRNPFNDSIFQLVEILSENEDNTTIITDGGLLSLKTSRLISIPEFIEMLEKVNQSNQFILTPDTST